MPYNFLNFQAPNQTNPFTTNLLPPLQAQQNFPVPVYVKLTVAVPS